MERRLFGIGVSPGIAIAPALPFDTPRHRIPEYGLGECESEVKRFQEAISIARKDLVRLHAQTLEALGERHADIFNVHLLLLDDIALKDEVEARIREEKVNVEFVLDSLAKRYTEVMESLEDPIFRERSADLIDVVDRLLHVLSDSTRPDLKHLDRDCVVLANKITPSDAVTFDTRHVRAIIMETGSPTSHAAILARALEIPTVVGLNFSEAEFVTGDLLIVDGTSGLVVIAPAQSTLDDYKIAQSDFLKQQQFLRKAATQAGHTRDGISISIMANIELPVEVRACKRNSADGIGLFRTEYLFLDRKTLPNEEEQYTAYAATIQAMAPHTVTLRTLDIGGDKIAEHLPQLAQKEENPQLGWRAVRFCLGNADIFKTQLRAMLRASPLGNLQIMFPMISGLPELQQSKALLEEVKEDLRNQRIPYSPKIKIGTMIEIPSAVMLAGFLAKEVDFFSIGTNDLIQYSLAVDRTNQKVAHLYEPAHPAVLRLIKMAADAAKKSEIPCSVCGEMAGNPIYTALLIGLGVTSLSMSSFAIPIVRATLGQFSMLDAEHLAQQALLCKTAQEVLDLINPAQ